MAIHSSILAWEISWTEDSGGLQSMGVTKESDVTEHAHMYKDFGDEDTTPQFHHPHSYTGVSTSAECLPSSVTALISILLHS